MAGRKKANVDTVLYDMDLSFNHLLFSKSDDPKKHVPIVLDRIAKREGDEIVELLDAIKSQFPADYEIEKENLNFQNDHFLSVLFRAAAQFNPKDKARERAVTVAFKRAKLDVNNPLHWRALLEVFCWAHFGDKAKPGKVIEWTDEKYCQLLGDVHRIKMELRTIEDKAACAEVRERYGKDYNWVIVGRLQRALREARNKDFNRCLVIPVYEAATVISDSRSAEGKPPMSKSQTDALLKKLSREHADRLGTEWASWRKN